MITQTVQGSLGEEGESYLGHELESESKGEPTLENACENNMLCEFIARNVARQAFLLEEARACEQENQQPAAATARIVECFGQASQVAGAVEALHRSSLQLLDFASTMGLASTLPPLTEVQAFYARAQAESWGPRPTLTVQTENPQWPKGLLERLLVQSQYYVGEARNISYGLRSSVYGLLPQEHQQQPAAPLSSLATEEEGGETLGRVPEEQPEEDESWEEQPLELASWESEYQPISGNVPADVQGEIKPGFHLQYF